MRRRPGRRPMAPLRPLAVFPALAALLHIGKLLAGEDLDDALRRQRRGARRGCRHDREGDRPDGCDDAMHGFLAKNAPSGPTRKRPLRFRLRIASAISTRATALSWHLLPQSLRMAFYPQWADGDVWERGLTARTGRPAVAPSDEARPVVVLVVEDEMLVRM